MISSFWRAAIADVLRGVNVGAVTVIPKEKEGVVGVGARGACAALVTGEAMLLAKREATRAEESRFFNILLK
jgi:hypothetical protein